jgi:signal peptidase I
VTARPDAGPAPATEVAGAGSRRPGLVPVLVAAAVATALAQALAVQSSYVPSSDIAPTLEPGDRVLVWKVRPAPAPGDVVVVDTSATTGVDRSTQVDDGPVGRVLASAAEVLGVHPAPSHRFAVVGSTSGDDVVLGGPDRTTVARSDVVGTVVLRVWPLGRFGSPGVDGDRPAAVPE